MGEYVAVLTIISQFVTFVSGGEETSYNKRLEIEFSHSWISVNVGARPS